MFLGSSPLILQSSLLTIGEFSCAVNVGQQLVGEGGDVSMLPVYVLDLHSEALRCWHYGLRKGILPFTGNVLIHYDSHPDLSFPHDYDADAILNDPEELRCSVDIGEFIIPMIYGGHVSEYVWIKPEWACQFESSPLGKRFAIGKDKETGCLRLKCGKEIYFVDDLLACDSDLHLLNERMFTLRVEELAREGQQLVGTCSTSVKKSNRMLLDIDLDYFATSNPSVKEFLECFGWEKLELLSTIFEPFSEINLGRFRDKAYQKCLKVDCGAESLSEQANNCTVKEMVKKRLALVNGLTRIFKVESFKNELTVFMKLVEDLGLLSTRGCLEKPKLEKSFRSLYFFVCNEVLSNDDVEDRLELISEAGFMLSQPHAIPDRVSIKNHIHGSFSESLVELRRIYGPPLMVTISKSQSDGYCPSYLIDFLYREVMKVVENVFGCVDVRAVPCK